MISKLITKLIFIVFILSVSAHGQDFITWSKPITISERYRDSWLPHVVIDSKDNIMCVWRMLNGDSQRTAALYFNALLNHWQSSATYLSKSVSAQGAYEQQVAMDADGDAWAIWRLMSGSDKYIQVSHFEPSTGWLPITESMTLSDTTKDSYYPVISMNQQGTVLACWTYNTITQASIYDTHSWSMPTNLSMEGAAQLDGIINDRGLAIVVWQRFNVDHYQIEVASYINGTWLPSAVLSHAMHNAYNPHVVVDRQGNAIAVWFDNDNGTLRVYSSKKPSGSCWQPAQLVSDLNADQARFPQIVMDQNGRVIILWEQYDGQNWRIVGRTGLFYEAIWSPTVIISQAGHDAFDPAIAIGSFGGAIATWTFYDEQTIKRIQVARYDPKSMKWTHVEHQPLLSDSAYDSQSPQIAYNQETGQLVVAWQTFDGFNWSVQAIRGKLVRPKVTYARQEICGCPPCVHKMHQIMWLPVKGAIYYEIFAGDNRTLLARISATCSLQFCNTDIVPCGAYIYYLYAIDAAGMYSDPTVFKIG